MQILNEKPKKKSQTVNEIIQCTAEGQLAVQL